MNIPRRPKGRPRKDDVRSDEDEDVAKPNPNRVVLPVKSKRNEMNVNEYDHFLSKNNAGAGDDDYMGDDHSYDDDDSAHVDSKDFNNQANTYYSQFGNYYCNINKSGADINPNRNQAYQHSNQYTVGNQNYNNYNGMSMAHNGNIATGNSGQIPISSLPFANQTNNIQAYGPVEIEHHDIKDLVITSKPRDDEANPAPFHCYVCKKKYRHKKQLVRHFQVNHTNDYDRVICDICNKEFTHKSSLVEHRLLHLPPKHECPVCQKRFNRKYSLKRHTLLHKGEKPFHCNQCQASFNHKKSLEIHLLKHKGILPYECNICNKRYVDKGTLSRHYLVHSGERKFVCHLCDLRFSQKIHLSKHYLTHDEIEKKLVLDCPVCGKKFYTKFNYGRHLETHNKRRGVKCDQCDKQFKFENGYQRHLEKGKCKGKLGSRDDDKRKTKKRRRKHQSSDDETSDASVVVKRQKKVKRKKRRKRADTTSEEEDESEEYENNEEVVGDEDEGEDVGERPPLQIKREAVDESEIPDVKHIPHVNPDYSENFDSEVEELSSNRKVKSEQFTTATPAFPETQPAASLIETYSEDEYIVPAITMETQQYNMGQMLTPFGENQNFAEQHAAGMPTDWTG